MIRPITGGFNAWSYKTHNYLSGVFKQDSTTKTDGYVGNNGGTWSRNIPFNANNGNKEDNPMAGHANGTDIHPYNISYLPLISY